MFHTCIFSAIYESYYNPIVRFYTRSAFQLGQQEEFVVPAQRMPLEIDIPQTWESLLRNIKYRL